MAEFDDLIKEFGSSKGSSSAVAATAYNDLIKEFGSGGKAQTDTPVSVQPDHIIPTPENRNIGKQGERQPFLGREIEAIKNVPSNLWASMNENVQAGKNLASEGISDISQNRPLSGVGKVLMGAVSIPLAPISAITEELIQKPVSNITGSERIGKTVEFLSTLDLPVSRGAKIIQRNIPTNRATDLLVDAIGDEKKLIEGLERLKANPRLSVIDVFPSVKQDAQKLVTIEGKHQTPLIDAIEKRQANARGQVESLYDEAMGAPIDVVQKIEQLKQRAKDTGSNFINPVVEARGPVDVTATVKAIDDAIASSGLVEKRTLFALKSGKEPDLPLSDTQSALFNVRQRIRGDWLDKDQMFLDMKGEQGLHEVQKNLRAEAQALLDSQDPLQRSLGQKLMKVRNDLVKAGGKEYQEALSKYADDMAVQEAFDRGRFLLSNRPTKLEDRPESLKKWLQSAKADEVEAVREGARVAIDNQIRSMRFAARRGTDIPEVEFNKQKLEMLFGKDEVENLSRKLRDEKDIAQSTSDLLKNSQTAMRLRSNQRVDLPERKENSLTAVTAPLAEIAMLSATSGSIPGAGVASVLGVKGVGSLIFKGKEKLAHKTNEEYSKLLTAEGEARNQLIKTLESYISQPKPNMLVRGTNALSKVIAP